jgi:uncharacterized protein (DUF3084 family)
MANYTEKELANVPAQELIEIIMELQDDLESARDERDEAENERDEAESERKEAENEADALQDELDKAIIDQVTVDLGLDTLQYKFEKGNLQLVQKFEQLLQTELNTVAHAEIFK